MTLRHAQGTAGKVWLVGAGPGDPGLLTVKGLRALEAADVIVADRLGARAVLDGLAADGVDAARRGRRRRQAPRPPRRAAGRDQRPARPARPRRQERRPPQGRRPVRLRPRRRGARTLPGGRRVEVEVVPGITSAISVPAIAGIPLTHRGVATAFTVVTGHDQIARARRRPRPHRRAAHGHRHARELRAHPRPRRARRATAPSRSSRTASAPRQRVTVGTLATIAHAGRGARHPLARRRRRRRRRAAQPVRARRARDPRSVTHFDPLAAPASASPKGPRPVTASSTLPPLILGTSASRSSAPVPPASTPATSSPTRSSEAGGSRRDRPVRVASRAVRPDPLRRRARPPAHQGHRQLAARDARRRRPSASSATSRSAATSRSTSCRSATTP